MKVGCNELKVFENEEFGKVRTVEIDGDLWFSGKDVAESLGVTYVEMEAQSNALMEVNSGTADSAIIDLLMAGAMIGEGTGYPELTYTVTFGNEEYGVGFRQGSELTDEWNKFWKEAYDNGTVMKLAKKYGVQESIIKPE